MSPFKIAVIVVALAALASAGAIFAAHIPGSAGRLGAGSDTVSLCKVTSYTVNSTGPISSVNATMVCSVTGTYNITATVTSGPGYGTGTRTSQGLSTTPATFSISISPSVTITGGAYNVEFSIRKA